MNHYALLTITAVYPLKNTLLEILSHKSFLDVFARLKPKELLALPNKGLTLTQATIPSQHMLLRHFVFLSLFSFPPLA